jgi:hypothetical protein
MTTILWCWFLANAGHSVVNWYADRLQRKLDLILDQRSKILDQASKSFLPRSWTQN